VAVDERLRAAAGDSLRDYGRRPRAARERMRLALRLESGDGLPAGEGDTLGGAIVAELAALANGGARPVQRRGQDT
jgi:hypothetical protein